MQSWGVKMVRVPTGYWNWIDLGWEVTPYTPVEREQQRFRNMQMVTPDQYEPYIDKIFTWAKDYDMKVLIELHGAPGSQNGEMHSGCITGPDKGNAKPVHYFDNAPNMKFALQTIDKMAAKCAEHMDSCYGVGVLNEPQPGSPTPLPGYLHAYLVGYYAHAI